MALPRAPDRNSCAQRSQWSDSPIMATVEDFRGGSRRDVALVFSESSKTLYEAAKALGRPTGSIANLVKRMHSEGLLTADPDPPVRGTLYRLDPTAHAALEAALTQGQPTGRLQEHQRFLLVEGVSDALLLHRILARPALSAPVEWAAEIDGSGRRLLAMEPNASSLQVEKLLVALTQAGLRCEQRRVGELLGSEELRRKSVALVETAEVKG